MSSRRGKLSRQRHVTISNQFLSRRSVASLDVDSGRTYSVTVVLHFFPVFQVHGPDVAIEQAIGVRHCVRPRAAKTHVLDRDAT